MQLATAGLNQIDVVNDILLNFSDSTTVTPNFWLDRKAGIPYLIAVQNPKYRVNTVEGLLHIPVSSPLTTAITALMRSLHTGTPLYCRGGKSSEYSTGL